MARRFLSRARPCALPASRRSFTTRPTLKLDLVPERSHGAIPPPMAIGAMPQSMRPATETTFNPPILPGTEPSKSDVFNSVSSLHPSASLVLPEHLHFSGEATGGVLGLSTIDHIAPRSYCPRVHCFSLPHGVRKSQIIAYLKQSLRNALTELPHFAGKVVPVQRPSNGVGIEMDGLGAILFEKDFEHPLRTKEWTHGSYDDLRAAGFPLSQLPFNELIPNRPADQVFGQRCLYIQANFIPGGLLLSTLYHHVASDAPGYSMFFESWARHFAAISQGFTAESSPPSLKSLDRSRLSRGRPGMKLRDFPQWKLAEDPAALAKLPANTQIFAKLTSPQEDQALIHPQIFYISEHKLKQLKLDISGGRRHISTVEALSSLVWRHASLARGLLAKYPTSVLSITCNTRPRMGLPLNLVGNACEPNAYTRLPLSQICGDGNPATLDNNISHIRDSIASVDEHAVDRLIGLLNSQPSMTHLTWNCDRWPGPDMLVSTMLNAGWNDTHWGPLLQQPDVSRVLREGTTEVDGRCYILPRPRDRRGVELLLHYPAETLLKLRRDRVFSRYLEHRG